MSAPTASVPRASDDSDVSGLERGACLGSYRLVLPIASGGMGRVWIAAKRGDFGFERMFAVKVMREDLANKGAFRRMFLDEAKLSARLRHTNVVEVVDLGEASGTVYQAMALVDGDSLSGLRTLLEVDANAQIPSEITGRIVVDVLRGLHAAHQLRDETGASLELVHRDVSPHNILVGLDGVSKIADFGVAKAVGSIRFDGPVGKRSYMAPEQLLNLAVDCRSDVFAVGVVLWELLAGKRSSSMGDLLAKGGRVEHPCEVRPEAHAGFADIAMRALSRRPDDRFPSADAMADAIEQAAFQSGIALSNKRVGAWVSGLVGARVSRQREDARREFELSQVSVRVRKSDGPGPSQSRTARIVPIRGAVPVVAEPPAVSMSPPAAIIEAPFRSRPRVHFIAFGIVLLVVATLSGAAAWTSRSGATLQTEPVASSFPRIDSDLAHAPAMELPSEPPNASVPASIDALAPVASSNTHSVVNQVRPSVVHPRAKAPKAGSVPSLPYDNPYKH